MTRIIACFCTLLLLTACGASQNAAPSVAVVDTSPAFFNYTSSAVRSAAKAGLPSLVGTISNDWADFGFHSQDEVASAQLGGPYPVFVLKNPGKSNQSIAATAQWEFPVTANDQYRCMLTMDKINGELVAASIGSARYAEALQTTENTHPGLSIKNKAILRVFGFSSGYYDILAINLSDPQPSFLMVGSADEDFVYFKGGKITRTEAKRVSIALCFGAVGVAVTLLIGANSSPAGKGIVLVFAVAGYLAGMKIFPKPSR